MKKIFFCVSLVLSGLMCSCVDKYEEVDADSKPSWLGGSIYAELENPTHLDGTFKNYLRLIDDLGMHETLSRTGSMTVFPANDEAFERFYRENDWNVRRYEDLSVAQKNMLLKSSMLENALLLSLLPNAQGKSEPLKGRALKHPSRVSVIDSIQHLSPTDSMPQGNRFWEPFYSKGIDVVSDASDVPMIHLTREYMLANDITTSGTNSDFAIITGTPYSAGMAYIFNDRVVKSDVTCQNGYIQQMEDVLLSPGNMAQVIRRNKNTKLMSRMLDYYSAPYYNKTLTEQYNRWAKDNNKPLKDSIYEWRYLSHRSQDKSNIQIPEHIALNASVKSEEALSFDPGWNSYYYRPGKPEAGIEYEIMDMAAFFVPNDDAVWNYFRPGANGAYLIDIYGVPGLANTKENLPLNLDSLHAKDQTILAKFLKNLMKPQFTANVPSKFSTVTNDAAENMGLKEDLLAKKGDKYDITIANNGAVYVLNEMIAPDECQAVLAPSSFYPDMHVMNWCVQDGTNNGNYLGVDFRYYLLAMSANYAFFVPEDSAFSCYYLDPATLGHLDDDNITIRPDVLHFFFSNGMVKCNRHYYNVTTGEVDPVARPITNIRDVKSQLVDILNYHTLVLSHGEQIGRNHYYQTKHGGTVYVDGGSEGCHVMGEWQLKKNLLGRSLVNDTLFRAPTIKHDFTQKNGHTYRMDRIIQPPTESVYSVLSANSQFSEFLSACTGFETGALLKWAGISDEEKKDANGNKLGYSDQDAYIVFTRNYKLGSVSTPNACLDYNVKMFNTYNYTLFAPDNAAMAIAYSKGLPKWEDIQKLYHKYYPEDPDEVPVGGDEEQDIETARELIDAIRDFVRYHFMSQAVYADIDVNPSDNLTMSSDDKGVAKEIKVTNASGNGKLVIKDVDPAHNPLTIDASVSGKIVNKMTRDYWFDASKEDAKEIRTSSFCVVHQISEPLCGNDKGTFK